MFESVMWPTTIMPCAVAGKAMGCPMLEAFSTNRHHPQGLRSTVHDDGNALQDLAEGRDVIHGNSDMLKTFKNNLLF